MMVLGIDPGPTRNGWALLDFTVRMSPVWFEAGVVDDVGELLLDLVEHGYYDRIKVVAVEQARALWKPEANVQAIGTAWAGGRALGFAEGLGLEVVALGVNEWRQAFVGHSQRGDNIDAKVENALRALVRHVPKRTNVHVRDAAGVACVAAQDWRPALSSYHVEAIAKRRARLRLVAGCDVSTTEHR
jgi:Holliday junction resolvasome RuvABC endonuclease subunit